MNNSVKESSNKKSILHYCGHIISDRKDGRFNNSNELMLQNATEEFFSSRKIHSVYGSLAAGADIIIAEAANRHSAKINIVLPFPAEAFVAQSVAPSKNNWGQRYQDLMELAASITQVYFTSPNDENSSYALCTEIAIGLAMLEQYSNQALLAEQLAIWDGARTDNSAGTFPDMLRWKNTNYQSYFLSSTHKSEASKLVSDVTIESQILELAVYDQHGGERFLPDLESIRNFIAIPNSSSGLMLDLDHQKFGIPTGETLASNSITRRAAGHIAYHYLALTGQTKVDAFENLSQLIKAY